MDHIPGIMGGYSCMVVNSRKQVCVIQIFLTVFKIIVYGLFNIRSICIESRCPDVLWLINNHYILPDEPKSKENTLTNEKSSFFKKFNFFFQCKNSCKCHCQNIQGKSVTQDVKSHNRITGKHHKIPPTTTNQRSLIMSIIFFFIYARKLYFWKFCM